MQWLGLGFLRALSLHPVPAFGWDSSRSTNSFHSTKTCRLDQLVSSSILKTWFEYVCGCQSVWLNLVMNGWQPFTPPFTQWQLGYSPSPGDSECSITNDRKSMDGLQTVYCFKAMLMALNKLKQGIVDQTDLSAYYITSVFSRIFCRCI